MAATYQDMGSDPAQQLEPLGVPLRRFLAVLRSRAVLISFVTILGVSGMAAYLATTPKLYMAQSSILVEPRRSQVSDLQALSPDSDTASLMRTQVEILRSQALARRVVLELGLVADPAFNPAPSLVSELKGRLRSWIMLGQDERREPTEDELVEAATARLLGIIVLQNEARSNVLHIKTQTRSPELAAAIANAFARQYLEFRRHQKFSAIERAHLWFSSHLTQLAERARETERAVEAYRAEHGLTIALNPRAGGPTLRTVHQQQMDEVVRQMVAISGERARKAAQLTQAQAALRAQRGPDALPEVLNSVIVQRLREQEAMAAAREAEIASVQGDRGPDLQAVRAQRRGLQRRIQEEMANATFGLANEVASARTQEETMRERLEELRAAVNVDNAAEVALQGLIAEAQANRQVYESFLVRATQLANIAGIQEPEAELVSAATPPTAPSSPGRTKLLAIALVGSMILGIITACLLERMSDGFGTPEALEAFLGISTLGIVPRLGARARRAAIGGRGDVDFATSVNHLCGMLRIRCQAGQARVIMVTSALPQEGKTMLSVSLAHSAAAAGLRVLLVDCDLRNPSIAATCGISPQPSLAEVLAGTSLAGAISALPQLAPGLDVMPSDIARSGPEALLSSNRLRRILELARTRYDLVVVDAPPVLPVTDALFLSSAVDATLMAIRWQTTPRAAVSDALQLLRSAGANVIGTALTQVNMARFARMSGGGLAQVSRSFRGYYRPIVPAAFPRAHRP